MFFFFFEEMFCLLERCCPSTLIQSIRKEKKDHSRHTNQVDQTMNLTGYQKDDLTELPFQLHVRYLMSGPDQSSLKRKNLFLSIKSPKKRLFAILIFGVSMYHSQIKSKSDFFSFPNLIDIMFVIPNC